MLVSNNASVEMRDIWACCYPVSVVRVVMAEFTIEPAPPTSTADGLSPPPPAIGICIPGHQPAGETRSGVGHETDSPGTGVCGIDTTTVAQIPSCD